MLCKIENCKTKQVNFIVPNRVYLIGRQEGDIIVNDKSVSRKHAKIVFNVEKETLEIEDLSKFGTFINSKALLNKKGIIANCDTVTFGAQPGVDYKCSLFYFDLIISTMVQTERVKLNELLNSFGGRFFNDWRDTVGYLVMNNLKVTYKVICALIKQIPIVTSEFIKEMHDYYLGKRSDEPKSENFLPPTTDLNIISKNISFKADINRKTLFREKIFYFLTSKKQALLELAITSANGRTVLITESNIVSITTMDLLKSPNSIVMYEPIENPLVKQVYNILKKLRKRPVIDSEIGFAVLHVSTEEYCNTYKKCAESIYKETNLTQVLSVNPFHFVDDEPQIVYQPNKDLRLSYKRLYDDSEYPESPAKKPKLSLSESSDKKFRIPTATIVNEIEIKNKELKENFSIKKNQVNTKDNCKENLNPSEMKSIKSKTTSLKESNSDFFVENSKYGQTIEKNNISDNFDDDFDNIELPDFGLKTESLDNQNNINLNILKSEDFVGNVLAEKRQLKELQHEVKHNNIIKKFSDRPITVVASKLIYREQQPDDSSVELLSGSARRTEDNMVKFKSLVVVSESASRININFKLFKKSSPVYFNNKPIALEIYRKNK